MPLDPPFELGDRDQDQLPGGDDLQFWLDAALEVIETDPERRGGLAA